MKIIKLYSPFIVSIATHAVIALLLLQLLNPHSNRLSPNIKIVPVAIISGAEFKSLFSKTINKDVKKITNNKNTKAPKKILKKQTSNPKIINKGSLKSKLDHGLNLDIISKKSKNYNNSYLNIITNKLEEAKSSINMFAAPEDVITEVKIKVVINMEGKLTSYKILQDSGYNFFDKAAIKILKIATPFPKPLNTQDSNLLEFVVPIIFDTV